MSQKVLFVDDEERVLEAVKRRFHGKLDLETANSGAAGLERIRSAGPFAVVVSDLQMPGMDGVTFLRTVREIAPQTIRIMLTGKAELDTAIAAVNEGALFRFLTKPCPAPVMQAGVEAALEQYRLVTGEKELLEKTLSGAIRLLTELLALVNPNGFSVAGRVRRHVDRMCIRTGFNDFWQVRLAAMLAHVGYVSLPGPVLAKVYSGQPLFENEREIFEAHPQITQRLLANIPRLEEVAAIVGGQLEVFALDQLPDDLRSWDRVILGKQMVRLATELERLRSRGFGGERLVRELRKASNQFHRDLLEALDIPVISALRATRSEVSVTPSQVSIAQLREGMVLASDIKSVSGILLVPKGQEVTQTMLIHLRAFARQQQIAEPIDIIAESPDNLPVGGDNDDVIA